jgi:integrase
MGGCEKAKDRPGRIAGEMETPAPRPRAGAMTGHNKGQTVRQRRAVKAFLFRTSRGHGRNRARRSAHDQVDAWRMVRKRALAAGMMAPIGNHSFRATGITAYLANGGTLEHAQSMAAHESPRTTKLYDRTKERLTQDEIERIVM